MRRARLLALGLVAACARPDHAGPALTHLAAGRFVEAEIAAELHAATESRNATAFRDSVFACTSHGRARATAASAKDLESWLLAVAEMQRAFDLWCAVASRGDERARRNAERAHAAIVEFRAAAESAPKRSGPPQPVSSRARTADEELVQRLLERLERSRAARRPPPIPAAASTGAKDW